MGFADLAWRGTDAVFLREARRLAYRAVGKRPSGGPTCSERVDAAILESAGSPVVVASHRRSGTHLTIDLLRRQFPACSAWKWPGEGLDVLYTDIDRLGRHKRPLDAERLAARLARAQRPLLKTHLLPDLAPLREVQGRDFVERLTRCAQVLYVVRDGRPVMVSAQRHEARLGVDTGRDLLDYMQLERDGMSRARAWADHVERWMSVEGVLVVRYEDILKQTSATLARIGDFLGLEPCWAQPLTPPLVRQHWQQRAMRITHVRPPTTALTPPTAPRPWQELFGPEEQDYFESQAGGVMRKLGYLEDDALAGSDLLGFAASA